MNTIHLRAGSTNTASGLVALRDMCAACERYDQGVKVPCVGVVLTDGGSTNMAATAAEATTTHNVPINVIAVGVDNAIQSELQVIASGPGNNNVFQVDQTNELANTVDGIISQACKQGTCYCCCIVHIQKKIFEITLTIILEEVRHHL